jgi:hypothetical protein
LGPAPGSLPRQRLRLGLVHRPDAARDDSEFITLGDQGERPRMVLLGGFVHETGHLLGHQHDAEGVMAETLTAGTRRTSLAAAIHRC